MATNRFIGIALAVLLPLFALTGSALAQDDSPSRANAKIRPVNDSSVQGTASLQSKGDRTVVKIRVDGALGDHPTHIHQGTCKDLDPNPEFPLNNVQLRSTNLRGSSTTTVDVPLDELLSADHLILIHKSEDDIGTYLACGDIVAGAVKLDDEDDSSESPMPDTGVGTVSLATQSVDRTALAAALSLGAFGVLAASVMLSRASRRERRLISTF